MSKSLIKKLLKISAEVYTIGKLSGIERLEELSEELDSLYTDIGQKDWHTGTPIEKGAYWVTNGFGDYGVNIFDGERFLSPSLIDAWQKIEPYKAGESKE